MLLVYFSNVSENTKRFVEKLGVRNQRIPLFYATEEFSVEEPYILVVPTYAGGKSGQGAVPKQVIKFLNNEINRKHLQAVIGTGNTNFGEEYCKAARIVKQKTGVPILAFVELLGTPEDVEKVQRKIKEIGVPSGKN